MGLDINFQITSSLLNVKMRAVMCAKNLKKVYN